LIGGPSAGTMLRTTDLLNWAGLRIYGVVTISVGGFLLIAVHIMNAGPYVDGHSLDAQGLHAQIQNVQMRITEFCMNCYSIMGKKVTYSSHSHWQRGVEDN
jgi:hypothetical protein